MIEDNWERALERCTHLLAHGEAETLARECSNYWEQTQAYWRQKISSYFQRLESFC